MLAESLRQRAKHSMAEILDSRVARYSTMKLQVVDKELIKLAPKAITVSVTKERILCRRRLWAKV